MSTDLQDALFFLRERINNFTIKGYRVEGNIIDGFIISVCPPPDHREEVDESPEIDRPEILTTVEIGEL